MAVRLWPQDFERKDHITKSEKALLRRASRNFTSGHFVVGIDPVGMSTASVKMGMYISPTEGLITFSIHTDQISANADIYRFYVDMVEEKIYTRLLDSKILIVRNGDNKTLKFPYKHIIMFPDAKIGRTALSSEQRNRLRNYITYDFFRPITSTGKEKTLSELAIFDGIRKPYDGSFRELSDSECRAIFERLAPEYTVIMPEVENVHIEEKKNVITEQDMRITGKEVEYKTFFLDEYQVAQVNDMGTGHRVILANPGAGKSVLLLSKAFKYASLYKDSKVLLTCYNNNLADSYNFKRACADFGNNNNLFIMTFHRLVKKIYEEVLHMRTSSNIATEEEIRFCIDKVRNGVIDLRFRAIFIDEVQNFDPLYLELCYLLLEKDENATFLLAGVLNQAVRAQSRRGDVPWKRINGVKLDFTGRVRYIEKNYRNSKEIGEYLFGMLQLMNNRLSALGLINSMEYEYNSFTMGNNPTIALKVKTGINRVDIKKEVIETIKEIVNKYHVSYSDIAVLFPVRRRQYLRYYFLYWLEEALKEADIPYSMIISNDEAQYSKTKYSNTSGVVISTIESSLGLDFKAVVLAGLFPYNYVFSKENKSKEIKSWSGIQRMSENEQNLVQSQMRSVYTACSRARDILYVLSDLKTGSPMDEIISKANQSKDYKNSFSAKVANVTVEQNKSDNKGGDGLHRIAKSVNKKNTEELRRVTNNTTIKALVLETSKETTFLVDSVKYPMQKSILGKTVGDTFVFPGIQNKYKILEIK